MSAYGPEGDLVLGSCERYCNDVLRGRAQALDEEPGSGVVEQTWRELVEVLGLDGALLSDIHGGAGVGYDVFCAILAEVTRGSAGLAAMVMSHNLALWTLERVGATSMLARIRTMSGWCALGYPTELGEGRIECGFVPGGVGAAAIVFVSADGSVFAAEVGEGAGGMSVTSVEAPMGWRASRPAVCKMGADGAEGWRAGVLDAKGRADLDGRVLLGLAGMGLGISRECRARASEYAGERRQGGRKIGEYDAIVRKLAAMRKTVCETEELLRAVVGRCVRGEAWEGEACRVVKLRASSGAVACATDAVQVLGGYGYMREYGIERMLRDARYCRVYPRAQDEEMRALGRE